MNIYGLKKITHTLTHTVPFSLPNLEERTGVIYKIGCICGDVYIRETSQTMSTRIKEHKAACRLANFKRSAVAEHTWQDGHSIDWDSVEILDTATGYISRRTKEALRIKLQTTSTCRMNRDEGRELSPIWLSTLRDVTKLGDTTRQRSSRPRSQQQQRSFQPHPLPTPPPNIRPLTLTLRSRNQRPRRSTSSTSEVNQARVTSSASDHTQRQ